MTDTEELIKAALAKAANRAPHPGQIINALAKPRRRRRSLLVVVIGAAVVTAAITVPIAFRQSAEPVLPAPPATTQPTPPPAVTAFPMRYTVTGLPPGFVERSRSADLDGGGQARSWSTDKDWSIHLAVHTPRSPVWSSVTRKGAEQILVGGAPGWVAGPSTGGFINVVFMPDQDTAIVVQASGGPDIRERAIKAANSVRPDGVAVVGQELSFGTLPAGLSRIRVSIQGSSPATGEAWTDASTTTDSGPPAIQARVVPRNATKLNGWNVVVPTPDGREIELVYSGGSQLSEPQARQIAEDMKVGPKPDFSWLGK
ncbi:hypothetical protein JOF56_003305 [Kibdelosporangium banguiense]|uniref:Uncharacterized protein n=1 Tax=Kibdelosporangium banguiense TaxID=1365924 RepID=A0ABS4TET0_9PSEU|nr:hypothetical protein [Kibdelosporangium banguiense]MBP2322920.1 hypothetical protein [Kibdelosporangium banguiense]